MAWAALRQLWGSGQLPHPADLFLRMKLVCATRMRVETPPVTNAEHDGVLWVWGRTEASGDAQSGTVGTWRRIPGLTLH